MNQGFTGRQRLLTLVQDGPHTLLVAIRCEVGMEREDLVALLDTASEWCVLEWPLAQSLGRQPSPSEQTVLYHTRFGLVRGALERLPLRLSAAEGTDAEIEATFFVSADWPGPTVLGWRGGLERLRLAIDPAEDWLYFSSLG